MSFIVSWSRCWGVYLDGKRCRYALEDKLQESLDDGDDVDMSESEDADNDSKFSGEDSADSC